MDGRQVRWLLVGGLVVGGLGCTRNTNPPGFVPPAPPPPQASKSLFGGGHQPVAAASPGMGPSGGGVPIEAAPPRKTGQ